MGLDIKDIVLVATLSLILLSTGNFIMTANKYLDSIGSKGTPSGAENTLSIISIKASSCDKCASLNNALKFLNDNLNISDFKEIEYEKAQGLITQYGLKEVPALIISGNVSGYPTVYNLLQQIAIKSGDALVIRPNAPYLQLSDGKLRGLISITYLTDNSCTDCYDVGVHQIALSRLGIYLDSNKTIDISSSEGQALLNKYNITAVPTIIMAGDFNAYKGFDGIWGQVGSVESDGAHIFRNMTQLGGIKFRKL